MPTMPKTPVTLLLAILMVAAGVLGAIQVAQAEDEGAATPGSGEAVTVDGFFARTKKVKCTSITACTISTVIARCRGGNPATGGGAWKHHPEPPYFEAVPSRPHGGNPFAAAVGWRVDGPTVLGPGSSLVVRVLCARITP